MQKALLLDLLAQNEMTSGSVFHQVDCTNATWRLTAEAASAGFLLRHVGETINRFGLFLGQPTPIVNTTMGYSDNGQGRDVEASRALVAEGFAMLRRCIDSTPDAAWQEAVPTPFFGPVTRFRLFAHVLFHNSHHAGQIALTLKRGNHSPLLEPLALQK
ncbi:DinB family protein [Hymenobacter negativus]|uniref:DinB family protein n=1 Tax=Hymenobacter negativus TaxID=2795026 RepID=A0ABS3QNU9_9BACT|nr:DinB family protein [Hymenobacter negativus]MBO2012959.1 DinB family protein [Hymenobacter negativus]